jgi:RiboL-PSP-HEPN
VITCLETYLSSAYINTVLSKPKYTKKFYETFLDFQKEKITLSQLFDLKDKVEEIAKKAMYKVIYHNLEKVKPMFKDTFNIDFPNFSEIAKAIEIRHDIVHRNGRTKENVTIEISKDDISKLIVEVKEFVKKIDEQIHKL